MMQQNQPQRFRLAPWKWAAMAILCFVFIAGWLVPLNPGIIEVSPDRANAGDTLSLHITGYNTSFATAPEKLRAWLRLTGDTVIRSLSLDVIDERNARALFYIPSSFPVRQEAYPLTLVLDHPDDGSSVLPNAVFITPSPEGNMAESALWFRDKIDHTHDRQGIQYPFRNILAETIRNTYFHVPMWFAMIILFGASAVQSLMYFLKGKMENDRKGIAFVRTGLVFGIMGMITGMIWAKFTWNAYWSWDVKQNMSAIALLIYAALVVMRTSVDDEMQRARLTAGYNMFAFILLIPLLFIIPRMTDSLHPGNGGNPAFGGEDLDNTMRMVFYPAIIGWTLLGFWISQLSFRISKLQLVK